MKVLVGISHLSQVQEVPVELPLVAHRLGVLAQVFIFRDGLDQARIFIKHLLDKSHGGTQSMVERRWKSGGRLLLLEEEVRTVEM